MKTLIASLLLACLMSQTSCKSTISGLEKLDATQIVAKVKPYVQSGTSVITSYALKQAKDPVERKQRAEWVRDASVAIRYLVAAKKQPTQEELQEVILHAIPSSANVPVDWSVFAVSLSALYGGYAQQFPGNVQLVLEILDLMATGMESGARPYLN